MPAAPGAAPCGQPADPHRAPRRARPARSRLATHRARLHRHIDIVGHRPSTPDATVDQRLVVDDHHNLGRPVEAPSPRISAISAAPAGAPDDPMDRSDTFGLAVVEQRLDRVPQRSHQLRRSPDRERSGPSPSVASSFQIFNRASRRCCSKRSTPSSACTSRSSFSANRPNSPTLIELAARPHASTLANFAR